MGQNAKQVENDCLKCVQVSSEMNHLPETELVNAIMEPLLTNLRKNRKWQRYNKPVND